jgi:penicillin-binding protein 1C
MRARVARRLHADGRGNGNGYGRPTTRLNGHAAPSATRNTPYAAPARKPLFMLRHSTLRYGQQRRRKGSGLRMALVAALGTLGLLAALLLGGAGGTAWAAWTYLTYDLPSVEQITVSDFQSTKIYDRHGGLLWEVYDPQHGRRTYRTIDQIPRNLIDATLAAEDPTFYSNSGVDPVGILRAIRINLLGEGSSGASTITMQVVRMAILPEKDEASWRRKIREAILASQLTDHYGKDKILETYLNEIYYGSLAYGVDAAAEVYFGKAPPELTLAQCAFLAGLGQAPGYYGEPENFADAKRRQEIVLGLMLKNGFITPGEHTLALTEDVRPMRPATSGPQEAPHFVNYVLALLRERYGSQMVDRGGLKVFTTVDLDYQHLAERAARAQIAALQADGASNAAVVAMNPRTGEILAMLGSVDFTQPEWGQFNVAVAPRQPGSTLKPIMYAAALKQGYTAATMLPDVSLEFETVPGQPPYKPTDYDGRFRGPVSMRQALANSYNIPAVAMLKQVGLQAMIDQARAMGIQSLTDPARYGLSVVLGGGEVTLLELTNAYGTLANRGQHVPPTALLEVRDARGQVLEKFDPTQAQLAGSRQPALTPEEAFVITDILADNEARTPTFGVNSALRLSRTAAAKTGTTDDWRDSWVVGYTPDLVTGVWVGNNDGRAMARVAGARGAGPIWHDFMETVLTDPEMEALLLAPGEAPPLEFARPANLVRAQVCVPSGLRPTAACPQVRSEYFIAGTEPQTDDNLWKMFKVSLGGGDTPMLAGPSCAPSATVDRPFLVLPPEYQAWARAQSPPVGPPARVMDCATPTPTATATPLYSPTPVPGIGPDPQSTPVTQPTPAELEGWPGALAAITAPRAGAGIAGEVTITGSAAAPTFDYYLLEWGAGYAPTEWRPIGGGPQRTQVRGGVLGVWNTSGLSEGPYVIRLSLAGLEGQLRGVRVPVAIERTKPLVRLIAPQDGARYNAGDQLVLSAEANGPQGVLGVEFYVDEVRVAVAYAAPYVAVWTATPGEHAITAVAKSPANSSARSAPVIIQVGPTAPPTPDPRASFSILAPITGSTLSDRTVVVLVATPSDSLVTRVGFLVDGVPAGSATQAPFQWAWPTTPGAHTILAIGYGADGREIARAQTVVFVSAPP